MKRLPSTAGVAVGIVVAAVCVRLGIWQIARLHEKEALNARLRAALATAPADLAAADRALAVGGADSLRFGRWSAHGRYDETRQFLLMGRARNGEPGVEVITPLVPDTAAGGDGGGEAVLVDRGWIPSADAATAQPEQYPAPGSHAVTGLAEPIGRGGAAAYTRVDIDSLLVWSVTRLDADSVRARLPYPVRRYVLTALPVPGAPEALPVPAGARFFDESMHRGYAGQWFSFAAISLIGMVVLARRRRAP